MRSIVQKRFREDAAKRLFYSVFISKNHCPKRTLGVSLIVISLEVWRTREGRNPPKICYTIPSILLMMHGACIDCVANLTPVQNDNQFAHFMDW